MVELHAQIIKREGKNEYAVIPYEEFLRIQEKLDDYEDLRCLREAKADEKNAPTVGIDELRRRVAGRARRSAELPKKRASR